MTSGWVLCFTRKLQANYRALVNKNNHEARTKVGHVLYHLGVDNESQKVKDQTEAGTVKKANGGRMAFQDSNLVFFSFCLWFNFEAALR